ncbi:MAG: metalloregulator ArsR/SmtB family transcription factor [Pseudomonadota bacterium]
MAENAKRATEFLKALAHEARLMILCYLATGEKSVTELEGLLSLRQPTVSQQLARLRAERIIEARREGKLIYYSIADPRARVMIEQVYDMFCKPEA